ncbi:hypothetical protein SLEP1_g24599 [Rubroshorea leprosula]|uniref:Uncharacterized protein n=1 Tax=Rubroshorea leprosula TaxID=152421 RepID=A0AAV5JQL9_9ROSI|nr:hypothetical protein SLEP1_g24599 [Rubroshorea leprosula]
MKISLISYCFVKDGKLNKSHTLHCLPRGLNMFIWNTRCCCGLELWGRVSCLCQVR